MPQTFRLRLGDGTILMVDHGGLSTWESDPTAAVGTRNPNKWIPLKEFLIQERAEAIRRAREGAPPPPPSSGAAVTVREDGLPLIPPPPRAEKTERTELPAAPAPETSLPGPPRDAEPVEGPAPAEEPTAGGGAAPGELRVAEEASPPPAPATAPAAELPAPLLREPADPAPVALVAEQAPPAPLPADPVAPGPVADEIDLGPLAAESLTPSSAEPLPRVEDLPVIPLKAQGDEARAVTVPAAPVAAPEAAPGVQPLADDLASPPRERSRRARASHEAPEPRPGAPVRRPLLVVAALQWTALLGVLLSRLLTPFNRLERGLPLFGVDDPLAPPEAGPTPAAEISFPTLELGLDAVTSRVASALRGLPDRGRRWRDGLTARASDLMARHRRPSPSTGPEEEAAPLPILPAGPVAAEEGPGSSPPEPLITPVAVSVGGPRSLSPAPAALSEGRPPTPSPGAPRPSPVTPRPAVARAVSPPPPAELPALRLAPVPEPRVVGDIYAGDSGPAVHSTVGLWARRFFLTAAVLAGGAVAGQNWDTWSPVAGDVGGTIFREIDDHVRWLHLARERQELLDQASEQLPHLARDTVSLVLSTNRTHVLEAPVVFERAWGAAERGASTLTPSEARELKELRSELVDTLPPLDRERVRSFDRAQARGAVFPFDARRGLLAYARGARTLTPERRERLQTLLGKAIAAGLAS